MAVCAAARQRFAARPQAGELEVQASRVLLFGEKRQHGRIARDVGGIVVVEPGHDRRQRIGDGKALHVEPGLALRLPPPRRDAGEMIAVGGDQRRAAVARRGVPVARAERGADDLHRDQRVVHGERGGVLQEHAGRAGRARARPDEVAAAEALADVRARGDERLDVAPRDRAIRAPVVERRHELALGDDRQVGEAQRAARQVAPGAAIVRRVHARVREALGEALLLRGGDRGGAEAARPQEVRHQRADRPLVERGVQGIGKGRRRARMSKRRICQLS